MSMDRTAGTTLEADVTELRAALGRMRFPAQQDDALAALPLAAVVARGRTAPHPVLPLARRPL